MRCYRHRDTEAVGICKACQKGLCGFCAVEVGHYLACRGECEVEAEAIAQIVAYNARMLPAHAVALTGQPRFLSGISVCAIVSGGIFIALGLDMDDEIGRFGITGMGLMLMLAGCSFLIYARKLWKHLNKGLSADSGQNATS